MPPPVGTQTQPRRAYGGRGGRQFSNARNEFFVAEGALGVISTQPRGLGLYMIDGNRATDPEKSVPSIVIAAEQYGRIARMIAKNQPLVIEADIKNTYYPNPPMFNIVGEIPGTDKADEVVMLGAHFDSWHAATGAADNGVGSCAMLEVMRILKASGVKLRRTVRIGLWTGEEQGIIGSREYVVSALRQPQSRFRERRADSSGGAGGGRGGPGWRPVWRPAGSARTEAGTREVRRLFESRQRQRRFARSLPAGQCGGGADLQGMDGAVSQPGHDHPDHPQHPRHRS